MLVGWELHFSDVKTRSGRRTIDLDARTLEALQERLDMLQKVAANNGRDFDAKGLVFGKPDGDPMHPEYITRTFDRLVVKHGLPIIRLHDIRHTHATLLLKAGVPAKVVAERLGHATPGLP